MDYTNEMGLISKPLLREIAEEIRKKHRKSKSIKVSEFPNKISQIKPLFSSNAVILSEIPDAIKADINRAMQGYLGFFTTSINLKV